MLLQIFGAISSPISCRCALRRTEAGHDKASSETFDAGFRDFYVDDLLKSFKTNTESVEITKELQELLARGEFQLTKVIYNEGGVLNASPP